MLKRSISMLITASVLAVSAAMFCGCGGERAQDTEPALKPIIIGSDDYEPYNYIDADGNFAGVDVELAVEAFHRLGYEPTFRQIDWGLKDGSVYDEYAVGSGSRGQQHKHPLGP